MGILFTKATKVSKKPYFDIAKYSQEVSLDVSKYPDLSKQLQLLKLTNEDLAIIKQLEPFAQEIIPNMVEQFYEAISLSTELTDIINNTSKIDRLKVTLSNHLESIFKASIDS